MGDELERMVKTMEDQEKEDQGTDLDLEEETGSWLKDNLRIIISIIIVVAIAGGVYSYSKRNQSPAERGGQITDEQIANEEGQVEVQKNEGGQIANQEQKEDGKGQKNVSSAESRETEGSFIETAGRGDGQTHLARRALANYLEKNPDSGLTPEHKVYIEDYLRKNSGFRGGVRVGTSIEFSKDLVSKAIESSKSLNNKQLQNLHKFAVRVPSLS